MIHAARWEVEDQPVLASSGAVLTFLRLQLAQEKREMVLCLFLDIRHRLIRDEVAFSGGLGSVALEPRQIVRRALELSAASVIVAHNHPSGEASPSAQDIAATRKLSTALQTVDVNLLDHLIIARQGNASLRALGLL